MDKANENESMIIYQTWFENAGKLGEEKQTKAIIQIVRYGLYGEIPDNSDDLFLDLLLSDWMPLIDAYKKKRKGGAPKGNKNAEGSGAPKGNQNAKGNKGGTGRPKKTQTTLNVKGNGNGNVNANYNYNNTATASGTLEAARSEPQKEPEPEFLPIDELIKREGW